MKSLRVAIENLYEAFSDVPVPNAIDSCSHCFEENELDALLSTDLRKIKPDDLSSYASSAFLTAGDVPDYLYFLPRILEITVEDDSWWPDVEITGRAIKEADWRGWPEKRLNALLEFLSAAIGHLIETGSYSEIASWMCGVARAGLDVRPLLSIIENDDNAVIAYFSDEAGRLADGKLSNAFWELPNEGHDVIVEWFRSEKVGRIVYEAFGYKV